MKRLCVVCGDETYEGMFCKQCILSRSKLFNIKDFRITICQNNDNYYLSGWKKLSDTKSMLNDFITKNIKNIVKIDRMLLSYRPFKNGYNVKIRCIGKINKLQKSEEREIFVSIKRIMCDNCSRLSGRYHEAKIQIRGENAEKIISRTSRIMPKTSWIENTRDGIDVLFINKSDASNIAKYLRKKYDVKKSFKVVGSRKGKMLMRDVYSVR